MFTVFRCLSIGIAYWLSTCQSLRLLANYFTFLMRAGVPRSGIYEPRGFRASGDLWADFMQQTHGEETQQTHGEETQQTFTFLRRHFQSLQWRKPGRNPNISEKMTRNGL